MRHMRLILNNVEYNAGDSFTLTADEIFEEGIHLITGPFGSGKSLCAGIMAKIINPGNGSVIYENINRSVLLMQFPEYHVTTNTAGEEASGFGGDKDKILEAAGLLGREKEDPLTLSRGELRRLHLAAVLHASHDLVILDEPYAGVDEMGREFVRKMLNSTKNRIIILISHDITCLPEISYIFEIRKGVLHRVGTGKAILNWEHAPLLIKYLISCNAIPEGLSKEELCEAVCRIQE